MATYNVTADPAMRDYMLLPPGSLRKKRINELAEQIWSQMNTGSVRLLHHLVVYGPRLVQTL